MRRTYKKNKHQEMVHTIKKFVKKQKGYNIYTPTSLPISCSRNSRLLIPDILVTKENNITHIIEPESSTGGATILGKILLADKAICKMVSEGKQCKEVKPKLVFLYKPSFPESRLNRVKERVSEGMRKLKYIQEKITIEKLSNKRSWF